MMRSILSNRLLIGLLILVICAVGGLYLLQMQPPKEPIIIYKPVEVSEPKEPQAPVEDAPIDGHFHADGTWHEGSHDAHAPPDVSVGQSYIPEGAAVSPNFPAVDPNEDPVAAAYKRLDYIKNNPYAWGGVHSERATQLIAELMPPPVLIDHNDGDEVSALMYELIAQNDPRAAEVIIANACDGYIGSSGDALVEIGPPAVPYILPYLERGMVEGGVMSITIFWSLSGIGEQYRADLGGIVEHIIIPKFEEIAADENNEHYSRGAVIDAKKALSVLGR